MKKTIKFFKYFIIHKFYVFIECVKFGIIFRGIIHDFSKLSKKELIPYMNKFFSIKSKSGLKFQKAWLNHIHKNEHHWQHWCLIENGKIIPVKMPEKVLKEMIADWVGAGKAQKKATGVHVWYEENKNKIILHPESRSLVEKLIKNIRR